MKKLKRQQCKGMKKKKQCSCRNIKFPIAFCNNKGFLKVWMGQLLGFEAINKQSYVNQMFSEIRFCKQCSAFLQIWEHFKTFLVPFSDSICTPQCPGGFLGHQYPLQGQTCPVRERIWPALAVRCNRCFRFADWLMWPTGFVKL